MKVFVSRSIPMSGVDFLRSKGVEVKVWDKGQPTIEEIELSCKDCNGLISMLSDNIDEKFLKRNSHLKVISNYAVGYNNIDISAAKSLGMKVGNTPDILTEATADMAFTLMLAVARNLFSSNQSIREGNWTTWEPKGHLGIQLKGKTIGIVGMGRIGAEMARKCKGAYGMNVLYTSRTAKSTIEEELGAKKVSFEELLEKSDVVSIHTDLNAETRGIFNKGAFGRMKSTAIFVNTARGGVCVEKDLVEALKKGELYGAGLDVTDPEPMDISSPLLEMSQVVITPHIGSATFEAREGMSMICGENIWRGLNGQKLLAEV